LSELKKTFALYSRDNKQRRDHRLKDAIQDKQAAFERKKKELLNKS